MHHAIWLWAAFIAFILGLLALDLVVFHRKAHEIRIREALLWSLFWIVLSLLFNVGVYVFSDLKTALEFFTGYLIEKSLSVDNLFVFLLIFSYFKVPAKYQHRVLFFGILGALIMRGLLIALGVTLIREFHWILYLFGAFLVFTGVKMAFQKEVGEIHPERNPLVRFFRKIAPVTPGYHEGNFFTRAGGKTFATLLFIVLIVVETTDLAFALDSIPAIFAITTDPFIIFTSNVFAILGLRALYFALAGLMDLFTYLKFGLSIILAFIGLKMIIADIFPIPIGIALGIVAAILAVSIIVSLLRPQKPPLAEAQNTPDPERPEHRES